MPALRSIIGSMPVEPSSERLIALIAKHHQQEQEHIDEVQI
jgi:hypothetical protein